MTDMPYDAVIFDLDGTLIDTEQLCNATGVEALLEMGHEVALSFFETLAGIHDAERARLLSAHLGTTIDSDRFNAIWDRLTYAQFGAGIPLKPGAVALLGRIDALGLPMALATSSRRAPAQAKLAVADLARWFRKVVTFDDVAQAKPAPDPYLLAAAWLGVAPARCLVFEDSDPGAQAAAAAGCRVVQVRDMHHSHCRHADIIADTLMAGAIAAGLLPA